MTTVVAFPTRPRPAPPAVWQGPAEVLLFTGVRYSRIEPVNEAGTNAPARTETPAPPKR